MYVRVQYYKETGFYAGGRYTYRTDLFLNEGDKVIAPTVGNPRQRAVVTDLDVPEPSFACKEITEYDPEGGLVYAD